MSVFTCQCIPSAVSERERDRGRLKVTIFLILLVVNGEGWTRFVSDLPLEYHRKFNEQLNRRFPQMKVRERIIYTNSHSYCLVEISTHQDSR